MVVVGEKGLMKRGETEERERERERERESEPIFCEERRRASPSLFIKVPRMPAGKRDLTFVPGNIIKSFGARKGPPEATRMLQGELEKTFETK